MTPAARAFVSLLVLCVFMVLAVPPAYGTAIGVNRAGITFNEVLRGGFAQTDVVVTTDSEELISAEVIVYDTEAAQWVNVSARNFTFSRDAPATLTFSVSPPLDARITEYRVNVSILTGVLGQSTGSMLGTSTRASLGVPITIQMTGTERRLCTVGGMQVVDTERGQPIEVRFTVFNSGNVRVKPDAVFSVNDKYQAREMMRATGSAPESILPTTSYPVTLQFPADLPRDQYWGVLDLAACGFSGTQTFDVLDAGETKDDGDFIRIDAASWADVGDIVPISAVFRNRGVRGVRANFRGTITDMQTGEIVKLIATETYLIEAGATANLETFFNPVLPGQYMIAGKVFYNDKLTLERNTVLNVNGTPLIADAIAPRTVLLLVFLGIVAVLLILIIRRRATRR